MANRSAGKSKGKGSGGLGLNMLLSYSRVEVILLKWLCLTLLRGQRQIVSAFSRKNKFLIPVCNTEKQQADSQAQRIDEKSFNSKVLTP